MVASSAHIVTLVLCKAKGKLLKVTYHWCRFSFMLEQHNSPGKFQIFRSSHIHQQTIHHHTFLIQKQYPLQESQLHLHSLAYTQRLLGVYKKQYIQDQFNIVARVFLRHMLIMTPIKHSCTLRSNAPRIRVHWQPSWLAKQH